MKINSLCSWLVTGGLLLALPASAQIQAGASSEPTVVDRGAHWRVWERTTQQIMPDGRTVERRGSYIELSPGAHYLKDGQWVETKEQIELFPDGAVARQGQHQ